MCPKAEMSLFQLGLGTIPSSNQLHRILTPSPTTIPQHSYAYPMDRQTEADSSFQLLMKHTKKIENSTKIITLQYKNSSNKTGKAILNGLLPK